MVDASTCFLKTEHCVFAFQSSSPDFKRRILNTFMLKLQENSEICQINCIRQPKIFNSPESSISNLIRKFKSFDSMILKYFKADLSKTTLEKDLGICIQNDLMWTSQRKYCTSLERILSEFIKYFNLKNVTRKR
ncbi:hypothetical protein BpHYR1_040322 [Brachionus plicatilis]|uniref:Uncharacterized protein n=1 Tax=Brachionus plicatilis TaxID=10195 RepID=A0A3M7P7M3_BRAPC|nr:hypothetical protein BpHYR1_040322 [Brachionus plicatilis]